MNSQKTKINALGIASLACGVVGILTICGCGIGGIFGAIGIILGVLGLIILKDREKVFPIAGLITSGIALIFGIGWLFIYILPNTSGIGKKFYSADATLDFNTADMIGTDYNDATNSFKNLGFTNIEYEEIGDLNSESTIKDGTIESITIAEKSDCKQGDVFAKDSKIVISYHTLCSYDTKIIVNFPGNLLFNKYDVSIYLDGNKIETLKHGQDLDKTYSIKEGKHTLKFSESNDSSVNGEVELDIKYPTEVCYKIICYDKYVDISEKYLISEIPLEEGQIQLIKDESEFKYKNYKDIQQLLSSEGFKNITLVPKYDIYWGITPEGEVQNVLINGFDSFKKGDIFNENDEVQIIYHMPYDQDPNFANSSNSNNSSDNTSDNSNGNNDEDDYWEKSSQFYDEVDKIDKECKDKPFVEYRDKLLSDGYNLEYIHENTRLDFTGELGSMTDDELNEYNWIFRGVYLCDYDTNTITLFVNTTDNLERLEEQKTAEEKLSEKLDPSVALVALETYGSEQYEYGFKIHMLTGRLGESIYDENTWFMKYKAKYKDWTGQWVECTVEGKIKGTDSNPIVFDFYVY